ncbi:MAG: 50S ribosomal protein L24e [Candidatus Thermoplasmatota archaeon]|nr:50S ribosomal protein L24e [Candidatus Thermoplasmatota archaeon]
MVEARTCSFCGEKIEPGTGRMYVKKDGKIFFFCSTKCYKNMVNLKRVPRKTLWSKHHVKE